MNEEVNKFVAQFREDFYEKFGTYPDVKYDLKRTPLEIIEQATNRWLAFDTKKEYPLGIRTKVKRRHPILYSWLFYKITMDSGYTLTEAGNYIGQNHATVHHAVKRINIKIEKNEKVRKLYENILKEIEILRDRKAVWYAPKT